MVVKKPSERVYEFNMSEQVWQLIKGIARRNDRKGMEDYLYRVMCYMIAHATDSDWTDPDRYINVEDAPPVECERPFCGGSMELDLKQLAKDMAPTLKGKKSNRERICEHIMELAKEWNKRGGSRVPYAFVDSLVDKI